MRNLIMGGGGWWEVKKVVPYEIATYGSCTIAKTWEDKMLLGSCIKHLIEAKQAMKKI
jgi:hypothetical protein